MKTNKENIPIPYTPLTIAPPLFRERVGKEGMRILPMKARCRGRIDGMK